MGAQLRIYIKNIYSKGNGTTTKQSIFIIKVATKGRSNQKGIAKDYFGFLLQLLFHDYSGLINYYN
jgi:hypothetical protein